MRTAIDLESNVLGAAKELARQLTRVGKIISQLVRQSLTGTANPQPGGRQTPTAPGFEPFPTRSVTVTMELIDHLRDAEGI